MSMPKSLESHGFKSRWVTNFLGCLYATMIPCSPIYQKKMDKNYFGILNNLFKIQILSWFSDASLGPNLSTPKNNFKIKQSSSKIVLSNFLFF
jgi:hypothetical protein